MDSEPVLCAKVIDPCLINEALLVAVRKGDTDVVKALLAAGADVSYDDGEAVQIAMNRNDGKMLDTLQDLENWEPVIKDPVEECFSDKEDDTEESTPVEDTEDGGPGMAYCIDDTEKSVPVEDTKENKEDDTEESAPVEDTKEEEGEDVFVVECGEKIKVVKLVRAGIVTHIHLDW